MNGVVNPFLITTMAGLLPQQSMKELKLLLVSSLHIKIPVFMSQYG